MKIGEKAAYALMGATVVGFILLVAKGQQVKAQQHSEFNSWIAAHGITVTDMQGKPGYIHQWIKLKAANGDEILVWVDVKGIEHPGAE